MSSERGYGNRAGERNKMDLKNILEMDISRLIDR